MPESAGVIACLLQSVAFFWRLAGKDACAPRRWTGKYDSVIRGDDIRSLPLSDRRTSGASSAAQSIVSMTPQAIRGPPDPPATPVVPWSSLRWTITELPFASNRLRGQGATVTRLVT